jgi:hypothetical protein
MQYMYIYIYTHTHIYILLVCVCVCVCARARSRTNYIIRNIQINEGKTDLPIQSGYTYLSTHTF